MTSASGQSALEAFLCFIFFIFTFIGYVGLENYFRQERMTSLKPYSLSLSLSIVPSFPRARSAFGVKERSVRALKREREREREKGLFMNSRES